MQKLAAGSSIRYIVELDKKARERVAEAKRRAEETEAQAESKKAKMIADYNENARQSLREMEKSYREEADKEMGRIEAEKTAKKEDFDKALSANREALADKVFEAVTGRKRRRGNG